MGFIPSLRYMSLRIVMTKLDRPFSLSHMAEHRNLDCKRYDKCLDKAIAKNWKSFSCSKCPRFKAQKEENKLIESFGYSLGGGGQIYEEGFV